jgi:hypothetical protein
MGGIFVNGKGGTNYTCNDDQFAVLIDLNGDGVLIWCACTPAALCPGRDMSGMP